MEELTKEIAPEDADKLISEEVSIFLEKIFVLKLDGFCSIYSPIFAILNFAMICSRLMNSDVFCSLFITFRFVCFLLFI